MESQLDITPYVFVYGTLKYGHGNWRWHLEKEEYIGQAVTDDKYVLGNVGFPFAFPEEVVGTYMDEDMLKPVLGDVFQVSDPKTLEGLDRLEGEGSLYHRRLVSVKVTSEDVHYTCWMYHNMEPFDLTRCYQCATTDNGEWVWIG